MASEPSSIPTQHATQKEEGAFHAEWQPTDSTFLQPNNLAISKVQRAWERKPLKPFSRQRLRVAKVWKRPTTSRVGMNVAEEDAERTAKRRKPARLSTSPSQMKPVKKMCLASDFGMVPQVLQWEGSESPVRKIVTRSNNEAEEGLIALPEEEETDEEGDITVEILDEDGRVVEAGGEELAEQGQGWEDDGGEQDSPHERATAEYDAQDCPVGDAIAEFESGGANETFARPAVEPSEVNSAVRQEVEEATSSENRFSHVKQQIGDEGLVESAINQGEITRKPTESSEEVTLPEGFVSPVKRMIAVPRRNGRQSSGSRRRTLPVQFAPVILNDSATNEPSFTTPSQDVPTVVEDVGAEEDVARSPGEAVKRQVDSEDDSEQIWEDVEDDVAGSDVEQTGSEPPQQDVSVNRVSDATMEDAGEEQETVKVTDHDTDVTPQPRHIQSVHEQNTPSTKLPSSPVPSIEGQHPRLPLRRSPRRKSSSPLKQSTIMTANDKPHLIAFTPIKGPASYPSPSRHPGLDNPFLQEEDEYPQLERSASAPPEEPQMSPQKPSRPRVSDDTALLQAFLNRAAENKNSRRVSATKRESISNRRDSDAVRQALASPAKTDVLVDLDPNSPSPRKPSASVVGSATAGIFDDMPMIDSNTAPSTQDEQPIDDSKPAANTRRKGRAAKNAQTSTPAAPNKIAIRGNTDGVVLKRSEAQEMALLTRNNTRKNKGGAVLPPLRLTKLASQTSNAETETGAEAAQETAASQKAEGAKGVRWRETLVEFYQGGEVSEVSVLSDELNAPPLQAEPAEEGTNEFDATPAAVSAPPPPSETPSKPKMRRLKPSRTAATPGKTPQAPVLTDEAETKPEERLTVKDQEAQQPPQTSKPAAPTKKRSRIATPAKNVGGTTLLSSDFEPQPVVPPTTTDKKAAPSKKKAPVSKLPAPASTSTSALGQGKENQSLISSPPKKRTTSASNGPALPSAKSFAPKLDFSASSGKAKLEPAANESTDAAPGLMSPAKKGGRTRSVFASGGVPAVDFGQAKESRREAEVPGLSSPAKKRTRRAG